MAHCTHDIIKLEDGKYLAKSHNFPEFSGVGEDEEKARMEMNRKIVYYADNNKKAFYARIAARTKKGLLCECGVKLDDDVPIAIYMPPKGGKKAFR